MYNYNFLKGIIVEKCGTQTKYAELLGITIQALSKKFINVNTFSQDQIDLSIRILDLSSEEVKKAFFSH